MTKRTRVVGNPLLAVAYIRVSKDDQKLGPDAQRASIEAWASREGVAVVAWFVDQGVCSVTAIEDRAALGAALAGVKELGAGVLVVAKRDRIARDVMLTTMVTRMVASLGASVVSAAGEGNGSGPADEFMRTVIDGAAQYERALIRARTKAALAVKRARGEKTGGGIPFGFRLRCSARGASGRLLDPALEPVPEEQAVIAAARELAEGRSLAKIAAELASRGIVSRSGRPFAPSQVSRLLATPTLQVSP
jgi:site-specific DNA recombinase